MLDLPSRLQDALLSAIRFLRDAGVSSPDLEARLLFAEGLGCDRAALLSQAERSLSAEEGAALSALLARRAAHEPLGRIRGWRSFWGLPFLLNEATLEPRPDSETLIEAALSQPFPEAAHVLDLGTGTGCLLLAFLSEAHMAKGIGVDLSARALEAARANAEALGLASRASFVEGGWDAAGLRPSSLFDAPFDLVFSNPPYIPTQDIQGLMPEVSRFDPLLALDGGADGLAPYRILAPLLPHLLRRGGHALFEIGIGQEPEVAALFREAGLQDVHVLPDLAGIPRVVCARRGEGHSAFGSQHSGN